MSAQRRHGPVNHSPTSAESSRQQRRILSSGGIITPNRSKLRKSLVSASETPGPPAQRDVYATAYCSSSGTYVCADLRYPNLFRKFLRFATKSVEDRSANYRLRWQNVRRKDATNRSGPQCGKEARSLHRPVAQHRVQDTVNWIWPVLTAGSGLPE